MPYGETGTCTYWENGLPRDRLSKPGITPGDSKYWDQGLPVTWMTLGVTPLASARGNIADAFDKNNRALRIMSMGSASGSRGTDMNPEQIYRHIYDATTKKVRTVTVP